MRRAFFLKLAHLVNTKSKMVIIVTIIITMVMLGLSGNLGMKNQFSDMMPQGIPEVEAFVKITENFPNASTLMIVVDDSTKNKKRMIECVEAVENEVKDIYTTTVSNIDDFGFVDKVKIKLGIEVEGIKYDTLPLVKRVDYKVDRNYIRNHAFMMQKNKDLNNMMDMFSSLNLVELLENINNNFEKEYVDDSENAASLDGKNQAISSLDGVYKFIESIAKYSGDTTEVNEAVENLLLGNNYFISPDNSIIMLQLQPAVGSDDWDNLLILGDEVFHALEKVEKRFPGMKITGSGVAIMGYEEMKSMQNDMGLSSVIALVLILILLVGSFGTFKNPLFSVITLVVALIWVTGILAVTLHYLNMMSAAFGVILIGLGIDFGIHYISGFRDGLENGLDTKKAIEYMYDRVGSGVLTGGLTTVAVFAALLFTGFQAMTQMGFSVAIGIIISLIVMMVFLPALIVSGSKKNQIVEKKNIGFIHFGFLEDIGRFVSKPKVSITLIVISIITGILSYSGASKLDFEYDMLEMQPLNSKSVSTQQKIIEKFEICPDIAMTTSKTVDEERVLVEEFKKLANKTGQIGQLDGISEYIPSMNDQKRNVADIVRFKSKLDSTKTAKKITERDVEKFYDELKRLHANIVEIGELSIMSDGNKNKLLTKCDDIVGRSDKNSKILAIIETLQENSGTDTLLNSYEKVMFAKMKSILVGFTDTTKISASNIDSKIKERYWSSVDSSYILSVVPNSNIWEEKYLTKFHASTSEISPSITGNPSIMLLFMDLIKVKGRLAMIMGFIFIVIFLYIDFRSVKYTIIAIIPLIFGALWMVGMMALIGMKFNYTNFMALPLILGIGIDDAVHILHRYRIEGRGSIPKVMRFTGRAVLLTSLTTSIGFGSMAFANHQGIASMGLVLVFGVSACFVSSVVLLPAIITIYEHYINKKGTL